jgi:hypothetical protein
MLVAVCVCVLCVLCIAAKTNCGGDWPGGAGAWVGWGDRLATSQSDTKMLCMLCGAANTESGGDWRANAGGWVH